MTEQEFVKKLQESGFNEEPWYFGDRLFSKSEIYVRLDHYDTLPTQIAILVNDISFHIKLDGVADVFKRED